MLRDEVSRDLAGSSVDALVPALRAGAFLAWVDVEDVAELGPRSAVGIIRMSDDRRIIVPLVNDGRWRRAEASDAISLDVLLAQAPLVLRQVNAAPDLSAHRERSIDVDMSNDVRVIDDTLIAKWQLLDEAGSMAGSRVVEHLAEAGFTEMPDPIASLSWHDRLLASLTRYLPDAKDGWEWMLDDVRLMLEGAQGAPDWPTSIGELTGRLHAAAARATSVIPRPVGRSDLIPLGRHYRHLLQTELDPEMTQALEPWRDRMERACTVVESATDVEVIPLHGDLHPGQFLLWREGMAIGDFDGNPLLSSADRGLPGPTAHDVAGVLRGFDHVAIAAARRVDDPDAVVRGRRWAQQARGAALNAYLGVEGVPSLDVGLLEALETLSPLHEAVYASTYLERWRYVPLTVLNDL